MTNEAKDYQPIRPYRLEIVGSPWSTKTYTTEDKARGAATTGRGLFGHKTGTAWRITKRLNKSGSKVEVIAEGVVP